MFLAAACVHVGAGFLHSGGQRHTCGGLLRAPTWRPFISEASPSGGERNSNRFRGSATRGFSSLTSHLVKGKPSEMQLDSVPLTSCQHLQVTSTPFNFTMISNSEELQMEDSKLHELCSRLPVHMWLHLLYYFHSKYMDKVFVSHLRVR